MILIRTGVFETNSSSTHTCIICKEDNYNKWCSGEYLYWEGGWGDSKEILNKILPDWEDQLIDGDFLPYSLIKDKIYPKAEKATFENFFQYVNDECLDEDIIEELEEATGGYRMDALMEFGLIPYDCFNNYYNDYSDGGETDITYKTIKVGGEKVPVVAYCAMTAN